MITLRQSTAVTVTLGPFLDYIDGDTEYTTAIAQASVRLKKNGAAGAQKNDATNATHNEKGMFDCPLNTTDTNTLGLLEVYAHVSTTLHVSRLFVVLPANVFDSIITPGTGFLKVDLAALLATTFTEGAAGRIAAAFQTLLNVAAPVLTTASVNQTGDNFARLGAPAGASHAADIAAVAAYVDTEVAAIKAKTDNLPSDPADASDIAASFASIANTLATLAGYVDTEVAAIKAKTDNLPSDPADASDIAALLATITTSLTTIAGYVDTEVAAIKAKTDLIPAAPAAVGDIPTAVQNADALLDRTSGVESGLTPRNALRLIAAACAGICSGLATTSALYKSADISGGSVVGTKTRMTGTVDSDGNRSANVVDLT